MTFLSSLWACRAKKYLFQGLRAEPKSVRAEKGECSNKRDLKSLVKGAYSGEVVDDGQLYSRIIWFHRRTETTDVDNIVEPVLDALEGVVYKNDFQVVQSLASRIDASRGEFERNPMLFVEAPWRVRFPTS